VTRVSNEKFGPDVVTLSFDIGGSGVKAALLSATGEMISDKVRIDTPYPCPPARLVEAMRDVEQQLPGYHRISVGFPGLVRSGVVHMVPSLSRSSLEGETDTDLVLAWLHHDLQSSIAAEFGVPVRVANDADVQGSAVISGQGLEFVMTLGTGVGTALFFNGTLLPHLELGHTPFRKGMTTEEQIGNAPRKAVGNERWVKRVQKAVAAYDTYLYYDRIYIGGGNARLLPADAFGAKATIVSNTAGILGGIRIWDR
jgi:polyphosphate glucokinase